MKPLGTTMFTIRNTGKDKRFLRDSFKPRKFRAATPGRDSCKSAAKRRHARETRLILIVLKKKGARDHINRCISWYEAAASKAK